MSIFNSNHKNKYLIASVNTLSAVDQNTDEPVLLIDFLIGPHSSYLRNTLHTLKVLTYAEYGPFKSEKPDFIKCVLDKDTEKYQVSSLDILKKCYYEIMRTDLVQNKIQQLHYHCSRIYE